MVGEVLEVMVQLAHEGMTMMCVTHEMGTSHVQSLHVAADHPTTAPEIYLYEQVSLHALNISRVGMVFQHFELFPHMTVLENLTIAQVKVLKRSVADSINNNVTLLKWF
jgi:ABC-type polar amino acid transport system ATPase subunit